MEDLLKDPKIAGLPLFNKQIAGEQTMRAQTGFWISVLFLSLFTGSFAVADIGDVQTFDTPEVVDGWNCEFCLVNGWNAGEVALDAGEDGDGDHALLYEAGGNGFHLFTWEGNETADYNFLGNLLDAGVVAIRFRARHSGIGEELVLRAYLFDTFDDGYTDWAISDNSVVIPNTGEGVTWQTYTISLREDDMESGDFYNTPPTVEEVLSAVAQLGLRHDPEMAGPGVPARVESAVYFDDIVLLFDGDNDGVVDDDDFCPDTLDGDPVDDVGCSDTQVDGDGDGICDLNAVSGGPSLCTGIDQCANTVIPDVAPTSRYGLGWYRWTLDNQDGSFTQRRWRGGGHFNFTVEDTRGCSCDQIITESGYHGFVERINRQYGCSTWVMLHWVNRRHRGRPIH